jgi:DNA mismatch repair protein MutL
MSRINLLPKETYEKIAAGEVVTSPLSVVKELVENSVDAGAARIRIEIEKGGKERILVRDNGSGIAADDITLAFEPHATSKISQAEDLENIRTLGFRGEALASIAAVSRLTLITKTAEMQGGVAVSANGGVLSDPSETGAPDGTSVTVEDLFYNIPARRKFLKSDRSEASAVTDYISKAAIGYPDIAFSLTVDGAPLFSTNGKGSIEKAIYTVYGESALLPISSETSEMQLFALVSPPDVTKKTRRSQIVFITGRPVKERAISEAVAEAYKGHLPENRHPSAYIYLTLSPSEVDVNVHPAKTEIRLSHPTAVKTFITEAITEVLKQKQAQPRLRTRDELKQLRRNESKLFALTPATPPAHSLSVGDGTSASAACASLNRCTQRPPQTANTQQDQPDVPIIDINNLWSTDIVIAASEPQSLTNDTVGRDSGSEPGMTNVYLVNEDVPDDYDASPTQQTLDLKSLRIVGTIFTAYIITADETDLYIIDQHAAHERINYEKMLAQARNADKLTQVLLVPYTESLPAKAKLHIENWAELLSELGFEAEVFGESRIIVRAFPAFLAPDEATEFLRDVIENAAEGVPENERALERLIARACRRSVKAGDILKEAEVKALIEELESCENPYTCPHGRPVFITLTKRELELMFLR